MDYLAILEMVRDDLLDFSIVGDSKGLVTLSADTLRELSNVLTDVMEELAG